MIDARRKPSRKKLNHGHVIWFTGMVGSGKTTLGRRLYEYIKSNCRMPVEFIDSEAAREFFDDSLGYLRKERIANIKRIVFASMLLSRNGVIAIVSNIAPYYEIRDFIRKHLKNYYQIYVKAGLQRCKREDIKGIYSKAEEGKIKNVIGIDDVYDEPRNPDLVVNTEKETVDESFKKIVNFLKEKHLI